MTPKKSEKGFTSFRILGKKAQELLQKAAELRREPEANGEAILLPQGETEPQLRVAFSPASIALATLIILGILVGAWAVSQVIDKLMLLLLGFFVAAIIDPSVRTMEKWGIPRGVAILLHFCVTLFIFLFLLVSIIPIIATQVQQIAVLITEKANAFIENPQISLPLLTTDVNERLTHLSESVLRNLSINHFADAMQRFGDNLLSISQGLFVATKIAGSVAHFFFNLILVLAFAFFIQLEKEHIRVWLRSFFSSAYKNYLDSKTDAIHHKIGQWARGQFLLALSIGILVFIALEILRMPYVVTLAVLAGMTEFIPYIGPLIAAVPAVLIAMTEGGFLWALIVAGVYYVIQWCENNLLVPLIMKRAVGISPIAIMFSMLLGVSFSDIIHPILGLLLAVPTTTILVLFIEDWRAQRQKKH